MKRHTISKTVNTKNTFSKNITGEKILNFFFLFTELIYLDNKIYLKIL